MHKREKQAFIVIGLGLVAAWLITLSEGNFLLIWMYIFGFMIALGAGCLIEIGDFEKTAAEMDEEDRIRKATKEAAEERRKKERESHGIR